ncbi:hypothetical protein HPP92_029062 [Vanilla planifolia]|uniref:Uncharacterized protein n=1 Tax=Vanilla planifolia TaxID=51239 RepID=A0A835P5A9_VANPL|nr:hypothetical protein HPP92_029051 [Vanilla planifolia]KAG0445994.1 hypothetical protein HPP92_029062 [Vanilla planifolia]
MICLDIKVQRQQRPEKPLHNGRRVLMAGQNSERSQHQPTMQANCDPSLPQLHMTSPEVQPPCQGTETTITKERQVTQS